MPIDVKKAKQSLLHEARGYLFIFLYLYACIATLTAYKFLTLREYGINFAPFGFAFAKALILTKFIQVGHMLGVGKRFDQKPLIYPTLYKAFIFFILLFVLSLAEEVIVGTWHGKTFTESALRVGGGTLPGVLAFSVVGFVFLLPYIALRQLNDVLGERRLFDLFFKSNAAKEISHANTQVR